MRPVSMKPLVSALSASPSRYAVVLLALFAGLVLILAIMLAVDSILAIGFVFERNYNEGWSIYNAERLIHHEVVYDDNYWRVNNYPIISFLVIAGVNFFLHDPLLSGRIVSLVSFGAIGALAVLATRRFGGDRIDAALGGGCALGFCYLVAPRWIAVDDPQTLAEAIMLGGLVVYLPTRSGRRDLLCAAFLVTLASFTKQGLVAIPLAISLDLALRSPRRLLLWFAACGGSALGFLILTKFVAGGDFVGHLLSPRIYLWYNVKYHLMKFLRAFKFPLLVVAAGSPRTFSGDRMLLAAYGVIAIAAGTFLSGVEGTSYNMFQDAAVFLAIASGVTMHELRRRVFAPDHWKVVSAGVALIIAGLLAA